MTGEMAVLDHTGDTKVIWDAERPDEVAVARDTFNNLKKKGYLAYTVEGKDGAKGKVISEFDPTAERLIMAPPMRGG